MTNIVQGLFSSRVVCLHAPLDAAASHALTHREALHVADASDARRAEYAAGRALARRALLQLGLQHAEIPSAASGAACWPQGMVGALTHVRDDAHGHVAVAVARGEHVVGLGLDIERENAITPARWPWVLTLDEVRALAGRDSAARQRSATLAFSAKESFFKLQFPRSGAYLDFPEVEVALQGALESSGTFSVTLRRDVACVGRSGLTLRGRYVFRAGLVVTALEQSAADGCSVAHLR